MEIKIGQLRNAEVTKAKDESEVVVKLTEVGGWYGNTTEIKIPAKSYELLEEAIAEKWLENRKSS